jgi:phage FluMu protein Com
VEAFLTQRPTEGKFMPIEFRCTQCQKLLRTQDDTAGKQAKCPVCGTLVLIPEKTAPPPLPLGAAPPPFSAATPPPARQAAEAASSGALPSAAPSLAAETTFVAPRLDVIGLQLTAWRIFWRNLGPCIGATLVATIVYCAATWSLNFAFKPGLFSPEVGISANGVGGSWLAELFIYSLLLAGQAVFFLRIARGQPAALADFFSGWRWALHAFLVCFLARVAVIIGLVLLVVPGVIVALMLSQAIYLVVDRNAHVGDALQSSQRLTHGHRLELFGLCLIVGFLVLVTVLFTCGAAIIVLLPWIGVLRAVVYLRLTGQAIVDDANA